MEEDRDEDECGCPYLSCAAESAGEEGRMWGEFRDECMTYFEEPRRDNRRTCSVDLVDSGKKKQDDADDEGSNGLRRIP